MATQNNQSQSSKFPFLQLRQGLAVAIGGLVMAALISSTAQAFDETLNLSEAPVGERSEVEIEVIQVPDPLTLDEAVYQLRRDGSRVLRAQAVGLGDIVEYHIRILTPDQRVKDVVVDPCCNSVWSQED